MSPLMAGDLARGGIGILRLCIGLAIDPGSFQTGRQKASKRPDESASKQADNHVCLYAEMVCQYAPFSMSWQPQNPSPYSSKAFRLCQQLMSMQAVWSARVLTAKDRARLTIPATCVTASVKLALL